MSSKLKQIVLPFHFPPVFWLICRFHVRNKSEATCKKGSVKAGYKALESLTCATPG